MRLSVATNFDPLLVEGAKGMPVVEFYGKLRQDAVGGGRAPYQIAPISRRQLAAHVRDVRAAGMGFNYLLNAACLGNRELTRAGQREIEKLLEWVREIGATAVTVATPQLLRLVKTRFPGLGVRISLFGGVDRVRKAQMWEELGADCIVLDGMLVNRELKTLERIRAAVKCDLELLVNNNCIMGCALSASHMNAIAHTAQSWHANKGFFIDWCFLKCTEMRLRNPVEHLRSEWIRPEDLHVYEALGYDLFKLTERDIPTEVMMRRIRAYAERRYDGNLLDLVQPYGFKGVSRNHAYYKNRRTWAWVLRFLMRPSLVNPRRLALLKRLADLRGMTEPVEGEPPVYVDNRALDGFIERFRKNGCRDVDCKDCRWCHTWTEKAVRVDEALRAKALTLYQQLFAALDGGGMWRHGAVEPVPSCANGPHAAD
ncbi:MAG: U32 family peptidase [Planctomycetota bacterium]|nr:U32 family peptidase [Planctomycetota bacterium]